VTGDHPMTLTNSILSQIRSMGYVVKAFKVNGTVEMHAVHFRKIVPSQSRRLMDQITILRAGEGIVVGSAFHIPSRVQIKRPNPKPSSKSSAPYSAWISSAAAFGVDDALENWLE
jgi:hypothetical protein